MTHSRNVDFFAYSRASEKSLLLGAHFWVVHNDSVECSDQGKTSYMTNLTLHACDAEYFACNNAYCIPMENRCDATEDCLDGSDEQECGKLIRTQGYKKELTPVAKAGQSVIVNFSLNVLDFEIYEPTDTFTSRISFTRDWFDERLTYKHLKKDPNTKINTLLKEEFDAIWFPYLVFYNVRNKDDTKQTEVLDVLEVIPNADFKYETEDNMHVFKGSENALSLTREYSVEWKCEYVYHWYPFDTQVGFIALLSSK